MEHALAPLKVAVVTPYFAETLAMLREAHDSVLAQTYPCRHILIADGRPKSEVDDWNAQHIVLGHNHADVGSTPALVGAAAAAFQGYDLIALLDSDNWYRRDHVQTVVELHQRTGAVFISTSRMLCRLDGSVMAPCPTTDPERFIDTSCMAYAREAFPLLTYGVTLPDYAQPVNDRCNYQHVLASGVSRAHSPEATVFYRCGKAGIYQQLGEPVPPGVIAPPDYPAIFARWAAEGRAPLI